MAGDDPGDHVNEVGVRLDAFELECVSISEAIVAQCSAPPSEPAKSAFLRFSAKTDSLCTRASHGIDHPGRSGNDMTGRDDEMNDPAVGALFAVLAAKPTSEIRVPTVMDLDLLPNMGRMTPRWQWDGRRARQRWSRSRSYRC